MNLTGWPRLVAMLAFAGCLTVFWRWAISFSFMTIKDEYIDNTGYLAIGPIALLAAAVVAIAAWRATPVDRP